MTARRRRIGSESEQAPLLVTTDSQSSWTSSFQNTVSVPLSSPISQPGLYDGPEHTDRNGRLGAIPK